MDRFFGTSDAYSHFLRELGHDAHEVVVNCEPLQRAWAREHGIDPSDASAFASGPSVVLAQAEEFRPDVVYVQDLNAISPRLLRSCARDRAFSSGRSRTEAPPHRAARALRPAPDVVPPLRAQVSGARASQASTSGSASTHASRTRSSENVHRGRVFVGARRSGSRRWGSNVLLERAAERVQIDFWGYKVGRLAVRKPRSERRYHGEAWGLDMYRVLARSKIAINRHRDVAERLREQHAPI